MAKINKIEDDNEEMEKDFIFEICDSEFDNDENISPIEKEIMNRECTFTIYNFEFENELEKNSDSKTDKSSTNDLVKSHIKNAKEQVFSNFNEISRSNKNIITENKEIIIKPTEILPKEQNLPQTQKNNYFPKTFHNKTNNYHEINEANFYIANVESQKFSELEEVSINALSKINKNNDVYLYRKNEYFYFRTALENEFGDKKTKQEMSEFLQNNFNKPVKIISHKDITDKNILQYNLIDSYILEYHILTIEKEIFLPKENEFFQKNGVWYKNSFTSTMYLKKRFTKVEGEEIFNYFILDFIDTFSNEEDTDKTKKSTLTILGWLSYFYGKLESSNIALVLIGDKKVVDNIFWKRIVKPIFGEEFCITINDDILKKSIDEIVQNKIFFHIDDFTLTEDNKEKMNELLEAIFVDKFVLDKRTYKKIPIYGQVLITSEIALSCMEYFYSRFEFIKVENDYSTIETKLNVSGSELLIKINENLDSFTDKLLILFKELQTKNFQLSIQNKMTKESLKDKIENKIEDNFNLEEKINEFIQAIKELNIDYFEKVKKSDEDELYKELEDSLKNEMIPREELSNYFNCVYEKEFFKDNNALLKMLKEKEPLFNQCVDKKDYEKNGISDFNHKTSTLNKKQYKIKDYTLKKSYLDSKNNSSN